MEILTPRATRKSTRIRVEIPVVVTSLDRMRPFAESCLVVVASAQGCGFRSPRPLAVETPIMISDLPGGASVTARVANCVPLGNDGRYFLVGAALYTHGNIWQIENPPEDWNVEPGNVPAAKVTKDETGTNPTLKPRKKTWPFNLFEHGTDTHLQRK